MNTNELKLTEYILRMLDGENDEAKQREFEEYLKELTEKNPAALDYYWQLVSDYVCIESRVREYDDEEIINEFMPAALDDDAVLELQEEIKNAPVVPHKNEPRRTENRPAVYELPAEPAERKVSKPTLFIAVASAAALVFLLSAVKLENFFTKTPTAYINDSYKAVWSDDYRKPSEDGSFYDKDDYFKLEQGHIELLFESGSQVVIESPAIFRCISEGVLRLDYGKACSYVPERAQGFTVQTPSSDIVDLGTEFGVEVNKYGDSKVQVYEGKTVLNSVNDKISKFLLSVGQAGEVERLSGVISEADFEPSGFTREIDSGSGLLWHGGELSLADIVGGGNGFGTGTAETGIEISDGDVLSKLSYYGERIGRQAYVSVSSNEFIDGVFCADNAGQGVQIASTGLLSKNIPQTSGSYWGYIFNGAFHNGLDVPRHRLQKGGRKYGTRDNPAITMHPNTGMTFDLNAIREKLSNLKISSFAAEAGISDTVEKYSESNARAFMQVIVDGEVEFEKLLSSDSPMEDVDIKLTGANRFLTLSVTEAGDSWGFDWSFWGNPVLTINADRQGLQ
ncbi:NPCBM/NEW2 domain-containing protein [Sedimentisphaera salicampi]|uniref:FecR protein n=1 Tax=Sedimentisphaera salicampi TaxID=1941349 RepID=A0A1W6LJK4_9BACT|nr:NPCBM/NEW2 domain-containing protein [Sedimentisphaera salicampi]ARN55957.1 FecR protein [Sedimentisphaera salicampi]